jgi:hypothetical protein
MLRKVLMILALCVAILPYLGVPRAWDMYAYTGIGMAMFLLLLVTKRSRRYSYPQNPDAPVSTIGNPTSDSSTAHASDRVLQVDHRAGEIDPQISVGKGTDQGTSVQPQEAKEEPTEPKKRRVSRVSEDHH